MDMDQEDARYLALWARWPSGVMPEWAVHWSAGMCDEEGLGEDDLLILRGLEASAEAVQGGLERIREVQGCFVPICELICLGRR